MIMTAIYKAHVEMPLLSIEANGKLETYIRMADLRVLVAAFKMVSHLARCGIFEVSKLWVMVVRSAANSLIRTRLLSTIMSPGLPEFNLGLLSIE